MTPLGTSKPKPGVTLTYSWDDTYGYHFTMDGVMVAKPKGTDGADTLFIDSSAGASSSPYPAGIPYFDSTVAPALDGKKGTDTIAFAPDDSYIDDGFFSKLQGFEVVQLADDDGADDGGLNFANAEGGSALFLGDYAFAAGIREVRGGSGSDIVMVGDMMGEPGTPSLFDAVSLTMVGGAGSDWLFSAGGDDLLDGGDGDDALWGGAGADVIRPGAGADMLAYMLPTDLGPVESYAIDDVTIRLTGTIDALIGFQVLDDEILVMDSAYTTFGELLQLPVNYLAGEIQLSAASGAFEGFDYDLAGSGSDTLVWFDSGMTDPDGNFYLPLLVAFDNTMFWEVSASGTPSLQLQYQHLSMLPEGNGPTPDPIAGTSANDIVYIDNTLALNVDGVDVYAATLQPAMDGAGGTDAIVMRSGPASIEDAFFANVQSFEGLMLAKGGSAVELDEYALAAGLTRVVGADGVDHIAFGDAYASTGVQVEGRSGDDTLFGTGGDDVLAGGRVSGVLGGDDGADTIDGKGGNDTIVGGTWRDDVTGGAGEDVFVLAQDDAGIPTGRVDSYPTGFGDGDKLTFSDGIDVIRDFVQDSDLLRLDENRTDLELCTAFEIYGTDYGIGDDQFIGLQGDYAASGTFTANSVDGKDVLLAYDADDHDGSIDVEFVLLVGVGGTTIDTGDFFGP